MIVGRFLIGADEPPLFRSTMFYGRKGLPIAHRPRYMVLTPEDSRGAYVRGSIKDEISFYITGPEPTAAKAMGFWGSKVPLPYDPDEGEKHRVLRKHRESVGHDYFIDGAERSMHH